MRAFNRRIWRRAFSSMPPSGHRTGSMTSRKRVRSPSSPMSGAARSSALLDVDQQKRLEADLVAQRERLKGQHKSPGKNAAKDRKKQASADPDSP